MVVTKERSFKQVVKQGSYEGAVSVVRRMVVVMSSEERLKELERCFVAALAFSREHKQVQNCLMISGLKQIEVSSMGANMVLLKVVEPQLVEEAIKRTYPWWRGMFSSVKRWSPKSVLKQRKVWLRVLGLPLHVWEEKCFKQLGDLFVDFVDFDEETISLSRLDVARICVNT